MNLVGGITALAHGTNSFMRARDERKEKERGRSVARGMMSYTAAREQGDGESARRAWEELQGYATSPEQAQALNQLKQQSDQAESRRGQQQQAAFDADQQGKIRTGMSNLYGAGQSGDMDTSRKAAGQLLDPKNDLPLTEANRKEIMDASTKFETGAQGAGLRQAQKDGRKRMGASDVRRTMEEMTYITEPVETTDEFGVVNVEDEKRRLDPKDDRDFETIQAVYEDAKRIYTDVDDFKQVALAYRRAQEAREEFQGPKRLEPGVTGPATTQEYTPGPDALGGEVPPASVPGLTPAPVGGAAPSPMGAQQDSIGMPPSPQEAFMSASKVAAEMGMPVEELIKRASPDVAAMIQQGMTAQGQQGASLQPAMGMDMGGGMGVAAPIDAPAAPASVPPPMGAPTAPAAPAPMGAQLQPAAPGGTSAKPFGVDIKTLPSGVKAAISSLTKNPETADMLMTVPEFWDALKQNDYKKASDVLYNATQGNPQFRRLISLIERGQ